MTYEEYESRLSDIVKAPDTAPVAVQALLSELKADTDTLTSLRADIEQKDKKIKDLQDTNIKLFLQQTGEAPKDSSETGWQDLEGDEALEAYIASKGE